MPKINELAALQALLATYEQNGISPPHQVLVEQLRETLLLLGYQGAQPLQEKTLVLHNEIIKLRTLLGTLQAAGNNPQKRFKTVQAMSTTFSAIQRILEN